MIDLCAGIGGIRRAFELTGKFVNVLSSEIDDYACMTYEHLFGESPKKDLTTEEFKHIAENIRYNILLAGFPCQTFSRGGLGEGFANEEKGKIFFQIAEIIRRTRPKAIFLENVDNLVTRNKGKTLKTILEELDKELSYKIIGAIRKADGSLYYKPRSFIRNSKNFGVPQNRPRTYIIGFDWGDAFDKNTLSLLSNELPTQRTEPLYNDLNDLLESNVELEPKYYKYYMSSGYFETLIRHREHQAKKGYGFGYRVVNALEIETPIVNTLLATRGSARERNLIYEPRYGISNTEIKGKKSPLNDRGIRVMTSMECGKLQGFICYAFVDENGIDRFSFPNGIPNIQKYKQFGNSVTIPAVEQMVLFMSDCLGKLGNASPEDV